MTGEYPPGWTCPECGQLHARCLYSAARQEIAAYFLYACPAKHEWMIEEGAPKRARIWRRQ